MYPPIWIISILSSNVCGILEGSLAVEINITWLRSNGTLTYESTNELFCSGSKTSNNAAAGSPLEPLY